MSGHRTILCLKKVSARSFFDDFTSQFSTYEVPLAFARVLPDVMSRSRVTAIVAYITGSVLREREAQVEKRRLSFYLALVHRAALSLHRVRVFSKSWLFS